MLEPETLFTYLKEIIQKIIVYKNENIEKLKKREITVDGTYDEILTNLETDVRNYIKVPKKYFKTTKFFFYFSKENSKLKLYTDTALLRMNDLNNSINQKDNELLRSQEVKKCQLSKFNSCFHRKSKVY